MSLGSVVGSGRVLGSGRAGPVLRFVVAAVAAAAAVVVGSSSVQAAAPEFLTADAAPEAAVVTVLAVGDDQTKVGPPVRARDADAGDTLTYRLSDTDAGSGHSDLFTISSQSGASRAGSGQISRLAGTPEGVYKVTVSVSDDGFDGDDADTASVAVVIHVTSSGPYPFNDAWVRARSVTAGDGSGNDWFGISVAASDEVVVVGAPWGDSSVVSGAAGSGDAVGTGAAYVFDAGTGAQLARLDSPDAVNGGWFGWEVEVVGDVIFVGASRETVANTSGVGVTGVGQVHVFAKPAGGWADTDEAAATLKPGETSAPGNGGTGLGAVQFGSALSVSDDGNTLVVGAPSWERVDATDRDSARINRDGAVFVFAKPETGWADASTDDTGVARLYAGSRVRRYDKLGNAVAISGDGATIAAAAPEGGVSEGYVYMFAKPSSGWASTGSSDTPVRLSATGRFRQQRMGAKGIDISGDGSTVVVGAPVAWRKGTSDDSQITSADSKGAAYVFVKPSGAAWADATQTAKLATFGHKYDGFGGGVAISDSGNRIAVENSESRSSNFRGSVYVYTKPAGGWADDTDGDDDVHGVGDNVQVLTAGAAADANPRQRYGFGERGLVFVGEDSLVVGQVPLIWTLHKKDGLSSLPAGGLYGANADHNDRSTVAQGSAYVFNFREAPPVFLDSDRLESASVKLLAVGDNQTLAGPPVRAHYDGDRAALVYTLSDNGNHHSGLFTIDASTGQISKRPSAQAGVYRVKVTAADGALSGTTDVVIHVTSAGRWPRQDAWVEERSVTADDGSANDWFGVSVDADDEVIVVGAWLGDSSTLSGSGWSQGPGAAYVFDADTGAQLARLDSPDAVNGGGFGWEVEVVGDTIFVAANKERVSTTNGAGQVHVFIKPATGWADDSTPDATLSPGPTSAPGNGGSGLGAVNFGNGLSVSDDGETVAVGAPHWEHVESPDRDSARINRDGAVFVFTKPATGWADATTDTTGVVRLYAGSRVQRYDALGNTIAISGDGSTIAAAAPFGVDAQGYVYMFTKPQTGWTSTLSSTSSVRLSVTGRHRQQRLGSKGLDISSDGSTVAVGAPVAWRKGAADDPQVPADATGAAYVFERPSAGWADATETAKLTTFGHKYDHFGGGIAVSASGDKIAVTNSDSRSSNFRGSAYVYTKPDGGWVDDLDGVGANVRVLTAAAADSNARQRYGFGGRGLAFVGEDSLVVGQNANIWGLYKKDALTALPAGGLYGANADMSNLANIPQGSAYLFKWRTADPRTQQPVIQPPPPPPPTPPDDGTDPDDETTGPDEPDGPPEFEDVDEDSVHAESIEKVAELRVTMGTSPTMFSPSEPVTRGQMATFVARTWETTGRECPSSGASFFDDVPSGSTHSGSIDCVSALGVARGTGERMFSPSADVSRAQMATFLANAWKAAGRTCPDDASPPFDDVPADSVHAESIGCIAALGITSGTTATMFSPSEAVTRAQMATFLARFHEALTDTT